MAATVVKTCGRMSLQSATFRELISLRKAIRMVDGVRPRTWAIGRIDQFAAMPREKPPYLWPCICRRFWRNFRFPDNLIAEINGSEAKGLAMPTIRHPDPPQPPFRAPICPDCDKPMRLESGSPDKRYSNIRHMIFVCDCGRTSDQMIADLP